MGMTIKEKFAALTDEYTHLMGEYQKMKADYENCLNGEKKGVANDMNLDKITYAMKSLCDEARQEGYNAGYEQGLEDAWECARRIDCDRDLEDYVFDNDLDNGFRNVSVSKAIVKIKEYDKIHKAIKEMAIITDSSVKEVEEAISRLTKKLKQEKIDAEIKGGEIDD